MVSGLREARGPGGLASCFRVCPTWLCAQRRRKLVLWRRSGAEAGGAVPGSAPPWATGLSRTRRSDDAPWGVRGLGHGKAPGEGPDALTLDCDDGCTTQQIYPWSVRIKMVNSILCEEYLSLNNVAKHSYCFIPVTSRASVASYSLLIVVVSASVASSTQARGRGHGVSDRLTKGSGSQDRTGEIYCSRAASLVEGPTGG